MPCRRPSVGQRDVAGLGVGHRGEEVAVGGQLAGLVDGARRLAGLRVAAGEGGEGDEDRVAAVAGRALRGSR